MLNWWAKRLHRQWHHRASGSNQPKIRRILCRRKKFGWSQIRRKLWLAGRNSPKNSAGRSTSKWLALYQVCWCLQTMPDILLQSSPQKLIACVCFLKSSHCLSIFTDSFSQVSCERAFSKLKIIKKTQLRASLGNDTGDLYADEFGECYVY